MPASESVSEGMTQPNATTDQSGLPDSPVPGTLALGARSVSSIMVIDLVESTRLVARHGEAFIARWQRLAHAIAQSARFAFGGKLMRSMGDGQLFTFDSPLDAVRAAFQFQQEVPTHNIGWPDEQAMLLRIALHVDTVIVDDSDIHGFGLALATRLLTVAQPGETVCSAEMRDQLADGVVADIEDLGLCHLKHLPEAVRVYRLWPACEGNRVEPRPRQPAMPPADDRALRLAVAVLPFECDADTADGGIVGELVADQLIAALSRGSHLRITSRLSSRALLGHGFSTAEVARRLQVAYVVSGRLVVRGNRLSLMAELASGDAEAVVWADHALFDARQLLSDGDSFAPQMAADICNAILNAQLTQVRQRPLPSLQSYSLLLGGIALMHRFSAQDFTRAKACLDALAERAPRHAEPHAWMARWHVFRAVQGWTNDATAERAQARDLCRRALDLDPDSALALTIAGSVETSLNRDIDQAQTLYRDALRVDPNEPLAWVLLGTSHSFKGEGDDAMRCCGRAVSLTPLDPMRFYYDNHSAAAAIAAGSYPMAVELASRSLRANRLHHSTLRTLAIAQSLAGDLGSARETVQQILLAQPDLTVSGFMKSSPSSSFDLGVRVANALRAAGLPD